MINCFGILRTTSLCMLMTVTLSVAQADVIDFEDASAFGGDNAVIDQSYFLDQGFQFSAQAGSSEATASDVTFAFEASGRDGTDGFWSNTSVGRDDARTGDLGNYFLKAGTGNLSYNKAKYFKLTVDYKTVSFSASGEIWDIDGPEQYQVTAFDKDGVKLHTTVSPVGGLDGAPWQFAFGVDPDSGNSISRIEIESISGSNLRGFAFDNFDSHATPVPAALPIGAMGIAAVVARRRGWRWGREDEASEDMLV